MHCWIQSKSYFHISYFILQFSRQKVKALSERFSQKPPSWNLHKRMDLKIDIWTNLLVRIIFQIWHLLQSILYLINLFVRFDSSYVCKFYWLKASDMFTSNHSNEFASTILLGSVAKILTELFPDVFSKHSKKERNQWNHWILLIITRNFLFLFPPFLDLAKLPAVPLVDGGLSTTKRPVYVCIPFF